MKIDELRKLSKNELLEKCNTSLVESKKVRLALKSGNISAEIVNKSRALKLDVAKIKTVLSELNLVTENEK
jgi:ribosomal protein L29